MPIAGDTGNGATLTFAANMGFGSTTTSLTCTTITPGDETVDVIDASTLATTDCMESIPSDLRAVAEASATFKFLTSHGTGVAQYSVLPAAAGTVTLTFPTRTGETTAASYAGTAFITKIKLPTLANGQLQEGEISWKYDGDTGPTYTKAS
jgi:hypothetical protein